MFHLLFLLALALEATCQRYHIADVGPYDELSAEELNNVYGNLGSHLGRELAGTHNFLPEYVNTSIFLVNVLPRVVHVALEVPAKENRKNSIFPRLARVAIYTPEDPLVVEYIVSTKQNVSNVTVARRIPSIKRPVDMIESNNLQALLNKICSEDLGDFLKKYYGASFLYERSSVNDTTECMRTAGSTDHPANYPACLFGMYASPRVTSKKPSRRITIFRLNRLIPPYNQHPIGVHITIDHTETDPNLWKVDSVFVQGRDFSSIQEFQNFVTEKPHLFNQSTVSTTPLSSSHVNQMGPDLCPRTQNRDHLNYADVFSGSIINKHVRYGPWNFHLGVRHETGLRIYNVTFKGEVVMNEAGMDETVTAYGGDTPFMRSMTSLESMYGVGSLTSELSPGIDCPEGAIYLSVPTIPSLSEGAKTIHNGICIYESPADVHEGTIRRFYQDFRDETLKPGLGYGTGKIGKSLYVVTSASIYNYQYSFVNVFSPTGSYACYVVPSGYIHVDNPISSDNHYGFVKPLFDLRFNLHTHHFLFYVDALGSNNMVEQIKVYAENERDGFDMMNMKVGRLYTESEGHLQGHDPRTRTAICIASEEPPRRCLKIMNFATMPPLMTESATRSFPWINKSVWFTKYKVEELRASSIYNGVDLTDPVVDFATFNNNESLNGDVVMWINVGFLHIPVNEDIPHTSSLNSQIGFILRPSNFFTQGADSLTPEGTIFTTNKTQWINGYVRANHRECSERRA